MKQQQNRIYAPFLQKPLMQQNSERKIDEKLQKDIYCLKKAYDKTEYTNCWFHPFIKLAGIYAAFSDGKLFKACLALLKQVNELDSDIKFTKKCLNPVKGDYDYRYQDSFHFIRGTLLDKTPAAKYIRPFDKNLYDFMCAKKLLVKMGLSGIEQTEKGIRLKGSKVAKFTGRVMLRFPILPLLFWNLAEVPTIYNSDNKIKEIAKVENSTITTYLASAILGAMFCKLGPFMDLFGIGLGFVVGDKIGSKFNKAIFE